MTDQSLDQSHTPTMPPGTDPSALPDADIRARLVAVPPAARRQEAGRDQLRPMVWLLPASIWVNNLSQPAATGVVLLVLELLPNCPEELSPQQ